MASDNSTEAPRPAEDSLTAETGAGRPEPSAAGVAVAGDAPSAAPPACSCQGSHAPVPGVVAAAECGCGGGGTKGCGCEGGAKSYVFAIGEIGFDFGTEARRDSFRQLMPPWQIGGERQAPGDARDVEAGGGGGGQGGASQGGGEGGGQGSSGQPTVTMPPNPYDPIQLVDYLEMHKSDSTKLIWTLNLDLTPIYAVEAEPAYAEDVYQVLRSALRNQSLPSTDSNYVSRVSIPGVLTGRTRRLFSGQVVPVVVANARGLYTWSETILVQDIVNNVGGEFAQQQVQQTVRSYLDKIYYQLRNLGQSSPDRALNYAATNAFSFAEAVAQGMMSSTNLPGGQSIYTLDTISVSKSPYCRIDSDCWDVQVTFFDPENDRRARSVYLYTIDVSDEMPVSLAPTHQFYIAS